MRYDAVIILGGGYKRPNALTKETFLRIGKGLDLFLKKRVRKIIISSGFKGKGEKITEAELLYQYCLKKGLEMKNLIKEEFSLDTIGNAFFTRKYITDVNKFFDLVVVTSDVHMERTKFIFKKVFDSRYRIKFVESITGTSKKSLEKFINEENKKFLFCKEFFKGIRIGDLKSIEKRLSYHPFYISSKRKDKHDSIFNGFRIKKISDIYS